MEPVHADTPPRPRLRENPAFRWLWVGGTVSELGTSGTQIAMPLLVLALTGSPAKAGLVGVVGSVAKTGTMLWGGVIADRHERRRLMLACSLARGVASTAIVVGVALHAAPLGLLLAMTFADAALLSISVSAESGLLADVVAAEDLAEAVTLDEGRFAAAALAGPPLGGALFGVARALPFAADACSFAVRALTLIRVPVGGAPERAPARPGRSERPRALASEALAGLRWIWRTPFLRAGALLYSALNLTMAAVELLALLILHRHHASSTAIGGAYAIVGVGGIASAVVANPLRRRLPMRAAVLMEPWVYTLLLPVLLVVDTPVTVGLVVATMLLPMSLSTSVVIGQRLALAPPQMRGRVKAGGSFVAGSLSWAGPLAMGLLVQYAGVDAAVLSLTGWALATAVAAALAPGFGLRPAPSGAQ
ncbi:MAG TPA: MFS transporter [Solirubrobacteraceae bacterium]|nr:MFS transporter [Solirubrobacteraceae bacterium]